MQSLDLLEFQVLQWYVFHFASSNLEVTAGPGLTNTITAVKNAQMAQSPVILIGGATSDLLKGKFDFPHNHIYFPKAKARFKI